MWFRCRAFFSFWSNEKPKISVGVEISRIVSFAYHVTWRLSPFCLTRWRWTRNDCSIPFPEALKAAFVCAPNWKFEESHHSETRHLNTSWTHASDRISCEKARVDDSSYNARNPTVHQHVEQCTTSVQFVSMFYTSTYPLENLRVLFSLKLE